MDQQNERQRYSRGNFSDENEYERLELIDTQQMRASAIVGHHQPAPHVQPNNGTGNELHTPQTPSPSSSSQLLHKQNPFEATPQRYADEAALAQVPASSMRLQMPHVPNDGLPHLEAYNPTPRFDLESVTFETALPAMTLRAWERRYGIPAPWRGGNSYTLYSQRDIAAIRWIRASIAKGISVRQAMTEFVRIEPEYGLNKGVNRQTSLEAMPPRRNLQELREPLMRSITLMDEVGAERILADAFATYAVGFVCQQLLQPVLIQIVELRKHNSLPLAIEIFAAKVTRSQVIHLIESGLTPRDALERLSSLVIQATQAHNVQQKEKQQRQTQAPELMSLEEPLLDAVRHLDELTAQRILDEAFFYHSVEDVCSNLLQSVLYRIGMLWEERKISVTIEHFASNLIRTRLSHLLQSTPNLRQGPSILVGCAPKETHEIGILMLALFWRRAGLHVYYLGQMLEIHSLLQEIQTMKPGVVCLSATTRPRAKDLMEVAKEIGKLPPPHPIFCFGGGAFGRDDKLIRSVKGVYLGGNATVATQRLKELVRLRSTFSQDEIEGIITPQ